MAYVEKDERTGIYYVGFRIGKRKVKRSTKTKSAKIADGIRARVEETIRLIQTGRLAPPPGADIVTFILSDGKLDKPLEAPKVLTLGELLKQFCDNPPTDTKDAETLVHDKRRCKHFNAIFGKRLPVSDMSTELLQRYVNTRSTQKVKKTGKIVSQVTIRNELGSIQGIWNRWAFPRGLVPHRLSAKGIVYPKTRAVVPFQTFAQIEKQIERGVTPDEEKDLWGSLYLTAEEIDELLKITKEAGPRWMHTLIAIACHTGARRGEMLRMQMQDLDLDGGALSIREKKKDRSREYTIRHVPLSGYLKGELTAWLKQHPGGRWLVCTKPDTPTTIGELRYHFEMATKDSKFKKLGASFHALRHSFVSLAASKGVDQRLIDSWCGHTTEAMRRRYRHISPVTSQEALSRVFG